MSTLLLSLARENPWPGLARRIPEPGRGPVSRGPELAAGRYDFLACLAARARRSSGGADQAASRAAEGVSAREPGAVSRKSVLSMRARGLFDSQIPLRGYFLWVGGALLVLLFAADSLLSAPLPSKLIESHSTLPPIRIASDLKGPEAVVIDTSQPGFLPMLPNKEIAAAPSPLLSSDVADAVRQPPLSLSEQADGSEGEPRNLDPSSAKRWRS